MIDDLNALRLRLDIHDETARNGPLGGMTFAVKDVFDVAGIVTGGGTPDWLSTHERAPRTAHAVQVCLRAGAQLIGITICDEMAFSPFGENVHYGTPVNPAAPDRVPGGSSSGSASATAGGLVDFALGTDTAGSVRIPASYCGLFGIRPTHGRISVDGVMPLSPSFDTVGWFARDAAMLERVGNVLLESDAVSRIRRVLLLEDAFDLADAEARPALESAAKRVADVIAPASRIILSEQHYTDWVAQFNTLRPPEIWTAHGEWLTRTHPHFGSQIAARVAAVERAASTDTTEARAFRAALRERAANLLGHDGVFMLPTVPTIAPKKGIQDTTAPTLRENTFRLSCIAPMLGLPEISLPLATVSGCPMGLSLIGPANGDRMLLHAGLLLT
jgi:amidase